MSQRSRSVPSQCPKVILASRQRVSHILVCKVGLFPRMTIPMAPHACLDARNRQTASPDTLTRRWARHTTHTKHLPKSRVLLMQPQRTDHGTPATRLPLRPPLRADRPRGAVPTCFLGAPSPCHPSLQPAGHPQYTTPARFLGAPSPLAPLSNTQHAPVHCLACPLR